MDIFGPFLAQEREAVHALQRVVVPQLGLRLAAVLFLGSAHLFVVLGSVVDVVGVGMLPVVELMRVAVEAGGVASPADRSKVSLWRQ